MAMPGILSQETRKGSLKSEWSGEGRGIKKEREGRESYNISKPPHSLFHLPLFLAPYTPQRSLFTGLVQMIMMWGGDIKSLVLPLKLDSPSLNIYHIVIFVFML